MSLELSQHMLLTPHLITPHIHNPCINYALLIPSKIVEQGLRANNLGYVTLETSRKMRTAMDAFLKDDTRRVFLLRLKQGAAGLTLVSASGRGPGVTHWLGAQVLV